MSSQQLATPHLLPWMQNTMGLVVDKEDEVRKLELVATCIES